MYIPEQFEYTLFIVILKILIFVENKFAYLDCIKKSLKTFFHLGNSLLCFLYSHRFFKDNNELTIKTSDRDGILGMYQLEASNVYGVVYSTAQISGFGKKYLFWK